jgi:hypothetical protein
MVTMGNLPTEILFHLTDQHPEVAVRLALTSVALTQRSVLCALFRQCRSSIVGLSRFIADSTRAGRTPAQIVLLSKALSTSKEAREHSEILRSLGVFSPRELSACSPALASFFQESDVLLYVFTSKKAIFDRCLAYPLKWAHFSDSTHQLDHAYLRAHCAPMIELVTRFFTGKGANKENPKRNLKTLAHILDNLMACAEVALARLDAGGDAAFERNAKDMLNVYLHLEQFFPRKMTLRSKDGPLYMEVFVRQGDAPYKRPFLATRGISNCAIL